VIDADDKPTLFQALLPPELRIAEVQEQWVKTAGYSDALDRLRNAHLKPADASQVAGLM
jgi:hypothetical protein